MSHLTHPESAELLPPLVLRTAADHGIRALLIKGKVADFHGLRPPQLSADVDVLIEPDGFDSLRSILIQAGWVGIDDHQRPEIAAINHSTTLQHPMWPIELDLHRNIPGMLAPRSQAFDALWDDRLLIDLAGQPVPAAGLAASVVVGVLHAWRSPTDPKLKAELSQIADLLSRTDDATRASVADLVESTGTADREGDGWQTLGILTHQRIKVDPEGLLAWQLLSNPGNRPVALGWSLLLRRQPLRHIPGILVRAFLGPEEELLRKNFPAAPPGQRGVWMARWWRVRDALADLPRVVRLLWKRRRGSAP